MFTDHKEATTSIQTMMKPVPMICQIKFPTLCSVWHLLFPGVPFNIWGGGCEILASNLLSGNVHTLPFISHMYLCCPLLLVVNRC